MNSSPLISATELKRQLADGQQITVVDCTFHLDNTALGRLQFEQEHIAGAIYADLDADLSAHDPSQAVNGGRHPLPKREIFAQRLALLGIGPESNVVVYDKVGTLVAGRLWWMLRWCGHDKVRVLDGGWNAWINAAGPTASGPQPVTPTASYSPGEPLEQLITQDEVLAQLHSPTQNLIDARGGPRYRGETEPIDPVAGHIPGALNRPFTDNFNSDGTFKSAATLQQEWRSLLGDAGTHNVVAYCGSGVSAVPNLLGLAIAGLPAKGLYAGSWSEWCRNPALPVAVGE